ncbi:bacterial regulatory helix-turn-helix s, AraC family protein [Burkholderia thailandensis MSMB121]|uniref:GlxA family transcriptional regulator n=1 Tax=Burkholderia humptydooensis TaxID=430531 RepID=UPI0003281118|nr:helix-turn-helix domain-containing protein [Burkholderia humptydooensis]AGK47741.1 bacterial regulatory helix-turn-helix s, AraC family protein [Burkholderia thailandensis MSMB121]ATF36594.1 transcriptional regulator [Burkholderia thailandensis]KST73985.1 transcriptional regulator [Burkholderia humptydooensis]
MPLIRIWAVEHCLASGVAAPIDILTAANRLATQADGERHARPFTWRVESIDGKPVRAASGQIIQVDGRIDGRSVADAVWLTGPFVSDIDRILSRPARLAPLVDALRRQHARGTLLATYCTGAFLLAEAGLLDARVATTHWSKAASFRMRYPEVELRAADVLTEQDGILCGGAVTSYQNLALRVVDKLGTPKLAAATAKIMLIDLNRVSQDSFIDLHRADCLEHDDPVVARAQRWMERHLREPFDLPRLSRHLALSERTVNRRFKQAVGTPPLKYLQTLRIEVAKRLLEQKKLGIDAVCERVGYTDVSGFRQLFKRVTGISPGEYRRRFAR